MDTKPQINYGVELFLKRKGTVSVFMDSINTTCISQAVQEVLDRSVVLGDIETVTFFELYGPEHYLLKKD